MVWFHASDTNQLDCECAGRYCAHRCCIHINCGVIEGGIPDDIGVRNSKGERLVRLILGDCRRHSSGRSVSSADSLSWIFVGPVRGGRFSRY